MTARKRTPREPAAKGARRILAIDIGGTHLKAALLDAKGKMLTEKVSVDTPYPCPPDRMVKLLAALVKPLPAHDRIAIGFPGVVRGGKVLTAPHWKSKKWHGFALAGALSRAMGGKPARLINDAEMQGLAVISGKGLEVVLTLGTGAGTAVFQDGVIAPHLELAHHPIYKNKTYNEYVGSDALSHVGKKHWNKRVRRTVEILRTLLNFDHLYIGGGNSEKVTFRLPNDVSLVSNKAGIEGGARLWNDIARKGP